ncbi:unnamed protein product [Eruca vesicaria subsp. sativa]|uniref:Phorbol-ester/DAG-type domain-containing protein n=1 Tax=Eruca vesicaria subsp. sativa TaxID=29727 RepID=A0ABC8KWY8_ERUVS|nr:unnamed protein product [Eruca vesicaria subsp. sativa]
MELSALKHPIHKHLLYPSTQFLFADCEGCRVGGFIYGGYRCNESKCYNDSVWFHKECVESPLEINHPCHPEHPLFFTEQIGWKTCHLCGVEYIRGGYCCAICGFVIDMACSLKPLPPPVIEHPMFHEHSLVRTKKTVYAYPLCKICNNGINEEHAYECLTCRDVNFHLDCVNQSREVDHSSHSSHVLEFFTSESLLENAEKTCILCGKESKHVLYHCSKCNFSICFYCKRNPPPLTVEHTKTHKHKLSLLARRVSFTCNVCGLQGDRSPYACIECSFLVHRECIDLPRVININRHDHRISLTDHIGRGNLKCGVCHKSVDQYCGGYTCSICPDFVVHSSCPIKHNVWDGIELEGIPEEEVIPPFEVVGDNLIKHFSHDHHILRLESTDGTTTRDEKTRCEACVSHVYSDPVYSCEQCDFILHETCANLPMKKRLPFCNIQFKLSAPDMDSYKAFECDACKTIFSGFRYVAGGINIDVRCGTFSELESYDFHDHPIYYTHKNNYLRCRACQRHLPLDMLTCYDCDFELDFRCFNLPRVVKYKDDVPPLSLCYGEEDPSGKYWCDICEGETNPKYWFYTCSHSGVTLHVQCVLGDFSFLMPRRIMQYFGDWKIEVVPNNHCSRPFCACCQYRCIGPFFLKISNPEIIYICSRKCFRRQLSLLIHVPSGKILHV